MITSLVLAIAVLGPLPPEPARDAAADDLRERASFRRPVALAALGDARVAVANRRSGSVSVIDVPGARVVVETHIGGGRIADLAALDDGRLLACDETDHRLLLLERRDGRLSIADTLAVAPFPADVEVGEVDGRALISVASLWSRAVTLVGLAPAAEGRDAGSERDGKRLERLGVVELPFSPREQLLIGDRARLVVADSFAGGVALIDAATRRLLSTRQLPAHNIRGLALAASGDRVLVSHQILNPLAPTNFNDVHWGIVINNVLRWLSLETVLDPEGSLLRDSWFTLLGDTGNAAGDPGEVRIDVSGAVLVALAGVGEIAIVDGPASRARRIRVGRRPTAVLPWSGGRVLVANTLGDSVSIVEPSANRAVEVSLGKSPPLAPRDRGELLFFDASLSHDGWFSCHSCHTDGHSNGLLNDNLGDGSFGAPKRVPSLLGTRATGPWGWDGRTATLEDQVRRSLTSTMQGRATPERVDGLVAYLRALPAPVRLPGADAEAVARGGRVFEERGCARCHRPPAYTTPRVHDVGLADEQGRRRFNPPSLRGVGLGGALLHDGRAADLEDLLGRLRHGLDANPLSDGDWGDLLAFLRSL